MILFLKFKENLLCFQEIKIDFTFQIECLYILNVTYIVDVYTFWCHLCSLFIILRTMNTFITHIYLSNTTSLSLVAHFHIFYLFQVFIIISQEKSSGFNFSLLVKLFSN